ncbi:hypothetical protein H072_9534 [Dactylellina haptotyla CBS 200.50]|uniref:Uncharacterized protein n=1 Tax=Dactylellina haptotyla (strain CBS 200.50) TaxID=1284197 RepID=S8A722_DACHA|nr:hypothetical protein H072_9534 [Dactylellina haptotyla CBS 200.50]
MRDKRVFLDFILAFGFIFSSIPTISAFGIAWIRSTSVRDYGVAEKSVYQWGPDDCLDSDSDIIFSRTNAQTDAKKNARSKEPPRTLDVVKYMMAASWEGATVLQAMGFYAQEGCQYGDLVMVVRFHDTDIFTKPQAVSFNSVLNRIPPVYRSFRPLPVVLEEPSPERREIIQQDFKAAVFENPGLLQPGSVYAPERLNSLGVMRPHTYCDGLVKIVPWNVLALAELSKNRVGAEPDPGTYTVHPYQNVGEALADQIRALSANDQDPDSKKTVAPERKNKGPRKGTSRYRDFAAQPFVCQTLPLVPWVPSEHPVPVIEPNVEATEVANPAPMENVERPRTRERRRRRRPNIRIEANVNNAQPKEVRKEKEPAPKTYETIVKKLKVGTDPSDAPSTIKMSKEEIDRQKMDFAMNSFPIAPGTFGALPDYADMMDMWETKPANSQIQQTQRKKGNFLGRFIAALSDYQAKYGGNNNVFDILRDGYGEIGEEVGVEEQDNEVIPIPSGIDNQVAANIPVEPNTGAGQVRPNIFEVEQIGGQDLAGANDVPNSNRIAPNDQVNAGINRKDSGEIDFELLEDQMEEFDKIWQ